MAANAVVVAAAGAGTAVDTDSAPEPGRVSRLWTMRGTAPASAGALGEGESPAVRIVDGLPDA